ncbi:uncharacterized protein LOC106085212 [Stomoxys calcitrans]|uniref:Invertebrate defensins family profile domain-containing protein n=1 Tax=Stomoxys calcitrans TaxID=35570 RepID=A0A1I8NUM1_STOCA|nr:uncharacterized protein LOC106085212 [Stomoxys calcitrans]
MKFSKISAILLAIFIIGAEATRVRRQDVADANDGDSNAIDDVVAAEDGDTSEVILVDDNLDNGDDEIRDLKTVAIKSRVITLDRELCREQSRYHPHYPKCQLYCENLKHWMGMCRRDTCHCYS